MRCIGVALNKGSLVVMQLQIEEDTGGVRMARG